MTRKTIPYSNLRLLSILGLICVLLVSLMVVGACGDDEEKAEYTLTIAVTPTGGGTTSPSAGTHTYDEDTVVTITATAASGYVFDKWSGASTATTATTTVTMTSNKTVTANFEEEAAVEYTLTMAVDPADSGTTSPAVGTHDYDDGTVVDITATAATGYQFDDWTGDVADDTAASTTVTMDANQTVTANFSLITYTLTMTALANVTTTPVAGTSEHAAGTVVPISAVPAAGWTASWTGDVAADATSVTMDADKTVTPVLTAATSWVYEVTHGDETTVWTYTIIDDSELVDSVECYVVDVSYDTPPARESGGYALTIAGATNWVSKATFDTLESVAIINMGIDVVTTMLNTYADGHGWDYAVNTAYQYTQEGTLDPAAIAPPFGYKYDVAVVGLTNVSGYECYEITYTLAEVYNADTEAWDDVTDVLEKTEWWSAEVGALVKSINHTGYEEVETMLLTAYIPAGSYVPSPA